jgi:serine/threonine-protein kinase
MGGIGMTVTETATAMIDSSVDVPDNACLPMYTPIQAAAYAGSGWSALSGQALSDSVGNRTVGQDLVLFASAHDATAFFAVSAQRWPACADRQFTLTSAGSSGVYTVGPVYNTGGTLSATRSFRNDKGTYSCQRALTVANNVAIDVNACSYLSDSPSGAGVNIAGQIAAKVPT